jgi:hypothetical protein
MSRFITLKEDDVEKLIEERNAKNTKKTVASGKKFFLDYCLLKDIQEDQVKRGTQPVTDLWHGAHSL